MDCEVALKQLERGVALGRGQKGLDVGLALETTCVLNNVFGAQAMSTITITGSSDSSGARERTRSSGSRSLAGVDEAVCGCLLQLFSTCFLCLRIDFGALEAGFTTRMRLHGIAPNQGDTGSAPGGGTEGTVLHSTEWKDLVLSKQKGILDGFMEATARCISVISRLYKALVRLVKHYCSLKLRLTRPHLVTLLRYVCTTVNPQVHAFLLTNVYNISSADGAGTGAGGNKRKSRGAISKGNSRTAKCERRIPELIYQMEQVDVLLIKLTGMVTDKFALHGLIKRSTIRDFRIMPANSGDNGNNSGGGGVNGGNNN